MVSRRATCSLPFIQWRWACRNRNDQLLQALITQSEVDRELGGDRIVRQIRSLLPHRVHGLRQFERKSSFGRSFALDHSQHRLIARSEIDQHRARFFNQRGENGWPIQIHYRDGGQLPRDLLELDQLRIVSLKVEVALMLARSKKVARM